MVNKKIITIILISVFLILYSTPKVEAWGPISHLMLTREAIEIAKEENINSQIIRLITDHQDYFYCGFMFPDVTVIEYYTNFTSYSGTHSPTFYSQLWQKAVHFGSDPAKAFTIGVGTHLLQDSIIHNEYIPLKITDTGIGIQNNIIHPVTEALIETTFLTQDESARYVASSAFTLWNKGEGFGIETEYKGQLKKISPVEFVEIALGISYHVQAAKFEWVMNSDEGFYSSEGYWVPGGGEGLWGIFEAFASVLKSVLPVEDYAPYRDSTVTKTAGWYASGDASTSGLQQYLCNLDPTGIDALKTADLIVMQRFIALLILMCLVIGIYYYKRRKRF